MIHCLIVKFITADVVRLANAVRSANAVRLATAVRSANAVRLATAVRSANAVHTPPLGHPGGSSVRLLHLTYISSRHGPRLSDACNTSPFLKVLRFEKLILAFLKPCSKSLHFLSFVSNAVVDNQRKLLKKM